MTAAADGYLERRNQRRDRSPPPSRWPASRCGRASSSCSSGIATLVAGLAGLALGGPLGGIVLVALVPLAARLIVGRLAERRRAEVRRAAARQPPAADEHPAIGLRPAPGARQRRPGGRGTGPHRVPPGAARDPRRTRPVGRARAPSPTAWRARTSSGWSAPSTSTGRSAATWPPSSTARPRRSGSASGSPAGASPHRRGPPVGVHPHRAAGRRRPGDERSSTPATFARLTSGIGLLMSAGGCVLLARRLVLDEEADPHRVLTETW